MTTDCETIDFFSDESLVDDPYPYFEQLRSAVPGDAAAAPRCGGGDRLRRGDTGLPRRRHVLVVQLGDRSVRHVPGAARGRRRQRDHRAPPRPAPDERAHGHHGPAATHAGARAAHAAHHAEAAQGERGVHVAPRRSAARRVRRRRPLRVHRRVRAAVRDARRGRSPRRARGGSPAVPRGLRPQRRHPARSVPGRRGRGLNPLAWLDDWFAEYIEDRRREPRNDVLTDLALATYPDGSTPTSWRSCARRRSCSPPVRRRPPGCSPPRCDTSPSTRAPGRAARATATASPASSRRSLRMESPVKTDFRLARRATTVGGVDIAAGTPVMLLNGAANRDPRRFECPAEFRSTAPTPRAHIAFGRGNHSCPGRSVGARRGPSQPRTHPRPHARHPALRRAPRPAGRAPLRSTNRPGCCAASTGCTSSSRRPATHRT